MKSGRFLCILLALVLFAACAPTLNLTLGQMPAVDPGSQIEAGMTTQKEVLGLFGPPDFTGVDADGLVRWTWTRISLEVKKAKDATITAFFNLEVSFDGEIVKSFSYSKKAE